MYSFGKKSGVRDTTHLFSSFPQAVASFYSGIFRICFRLNLYNGNLSINICIGEDKETILLIFFDIKHCYSFFHILKLIFQWIFGDDVFEAKLMFITDKHMLEAKWVLIDFPFFPDSNSWVLVYFADIVSVIRFLCPSMGGSWVKLVVVVVLDANLRFISK